MSVKLLAKLREFKTGMDLEKFMTDEFRQNMRSIDIFIESITKRFYDPTLVYGFINKIIENGSDYFPINDLNSLIREGSVKENFFYPNSKGRYWIEANASVKNSGVATGSAQVDAIYSDTKLISSIPGSQIYYSIALSAVVNFPSSIGFFADLSPSVGIGFKGASSALNLTISNLKFKIIKVG